MTRELADELDEVSWEDEFVAPLAAIESQRVAEIQQQAAVYEDLPLRARQQSPVDLTSSLVCVQCDGGRLQIRDRTKQDEQKNDSKSSFWRESKVGALIKMTGQTYDSDPCPEIPTIFVDASHMSRLTREIKGFSGDKGESAEATSESGTAESESLLKPDELHVSTRPKPLVRSAIATTENYIPNEIEFQTKPQIAIGQVKHALSNGIHVSAWTFDELYGRDTKFLDDLDALGEAFIGEVPGNFHGWLTQSKVIQSKPKSPKNGRPRRVPRVRKADVSRRVDNLATYSSVFTGQNWQRYRIKDTDRGPEVWEVKWSSFWRKTIGKLPTAQHTLIVARNVRTGEVKYFLSNRVIGRDGVTLRWLLRVATMQFWDKT